MIARKRGDDSSYDSASRLMFPSLLSGSQSSTYEPISSDDDDEPSADRNHDDADDMSILKAHRDRILFNFTVMSILFSANHGCVVACLALATSRLGSVGAWQSGILYLTYTLSALLGATYIVKQLGARNSLVLGMSLYVAYVGCFVVALQQQKLEQSQDGMIIWTAYSGAAIGGVGAGFLWTAQGVYFSHAAEEHAAAVNRILLASSISTSAFAVADAVVSSSLPAVSSSSSSTALLAGIFAFWYLAEEVFLRLLSTLLLEFELASWEGVFRLYTSITILSAVAMLGVHDFSSVQHHQHDHLDNNNNKNDDIKDGSHLDTTMTARKNTTPTTTSTASIWYKATAAIQLFLFDRKMKYMVGLNAVYGFASAFCNSYVNGEVVSIAMTTTTTVDGGGADGKWLGLLTAWGSAVAAILSWRWRRYEEETQKGPILIAGSVCFGLVGFLFMLVPKAENWGWSGLLLVYSLMGLGRATFEGTLKATFADYFAYEKEGAFANIIVQNGLSGSIGYILSFSLPCSTPSRYCVAYRDGSHQYVLLIELIVVFSSIAGVLGYQKASSLHCVDKQQQQPQKEAAQERRRQEQDNTDTGIEIPTRTLEAVVGAE